MLVSDPLTKATELSDAHFLLCAYVASQPFRRNSQSLLKPGSATQKDVHTCMAKSLNFATQVGQQSKALHYGT